MPAVELVSVREYLSTAYRPDCDYVDGVVVERNLGEYDHGRLQMAVSAYFYARRKEWRHSRGARTAGSGLAHSFPRPRCLRSGW